MHGVHHEERSDAGFVGHFDTDRHLADLVVVETERIDEVGLAFGPPGSRNITTPTLGVGENGSGNREVPPSRAAQRLTLSRRPAKSMSELLTGSITEKRLA
jgi:hypothetical protein